jgi:uncharacterized lipoprotein YddW (UPF0748 family)
MAKKVIEKKPIEKFYALYAHYTFGYPVVYEDDNGDVKEVIKQNYKGENMFSTQGRPLKVMEMEKFNPIRTKMSQGFLSEAVFDPNTEDPQELARGKALRELVNGVDVLTEEQKDKHENLAAWIEKRKRQDLEKRLADAEEKAARAEELEKRLLKLEKEK